ncbi:hypothetical protein GDI2162 [Gluconacetobacter diazotrophicus PA1 5]|uniref:Uncharacterized protein n=1 Tax=Gluconacetobacter diazotrophicus (strain ATCC 49037 / DSM 5601 / CCUG 37298 / CIP 103539 / LMG 7603 / PAl5) TaxID=272568 RepID=A9HKZ9_GLUDA|nr:hypothetical protein GDI2162 [Gluconacetobacter diazotrophicus PA1 5]
MSIDLHRVAFVPAWRPDHFPRVEMMRRNTGPDGMTGSHILPTALPKAITGASMSASFRRMS